MNSLFSLLLALACGSQLIAMEAVKVDEQAAKAANDQAAALSQTVTSTSSPAASSTGGAEALTRDQASDSMRLLPPTSPATADASDSVLLDESLIDLHDTELDNDKGQEKADLAPQSPAIDAEKKFFEDVYNGKVKAVLAYLDKQPAAINMKDANGRNVLHHVIAGCFGLSPERTNALQLLAELLRRNIDVKIQFTFNDKVLTVQEFVEVMYGQRIAPYAQAAKKVMDRLNDRSNDISDQKIQSSGKNPTDPEISSFMRASYDPCTFASGAGRINIDIIRDFLTKYPQSVNVVTIGSTALLRAIDSYIQYHSEVNYQIIDELLRAGAHTVILAETDCYRNYVKRAHQYALHELARNCKDWEELANSLLGRLCGNGATIRNSVSQVIAAHQERFAAEETEHQARLREEREKQAALDFEKEQKRAAEAARAEKEKLLRNAQELIAAQEGKLKEETERKAKLAEANKRAEDRIRKAKEEAELKIEADRKRRAEVQQKQEEEYQSRIKAERERRSKEAAEKAENERKAKEASKTSSGLMSPQDLRKALELANNTMFMPPMGSSKPAAVAGVKIIDSAESAKEKEEKRKDESSAKKKKKVVETDSDDTSSERSSSDSEADKKAEQSFEKERAALIKRQAEEDEKINNKVALETAKINSIDKKAALEEYSKRLTKAKSKADKDRAEEYNEMVAGLIAEFEDQKEEAQAEFKKAMRKREKDAAKIKRSQDRQNFEDETRDQEERLLKEQAQLQEAFDHARAQLETNHRSAQSFADKVYTLILEAIEEHQDENGWEIKFYPVKVGHYPPGARGQ